MIIGDDPYRLVAIFNLMKPTFLFQILKRINTFFVGRQPTVSIESYRAKIWMKQLICTKHRNDCRVIDQIQSERRIAPASASSFSVLLRSDSASEKCLKWQLAELSGRFRKVGTTQVLFCAVSNNNRNF